MNRRLGVGVGLGAVFILALATAYLFHPLRILCIEDTSNGKTIIATVARPGDNIWVVFINSVELLPVADHFVVNDDYRLLFTETIYQAPYAGYLHPEKARVVAPRTIRISGLRRQMEEVTFYAGYTSKHMLFLNGNWVPLYDVARGGDLIRIRIKNSTRLYRMLDKDVLP